MLNMTTKILLVTLLLVLVVSGAAAANTMEASSVLRNLALEAAEEYVEEEVAYLLGGTTTLLDYVMGVRDGRVPGVDIGVDASGLVRNVFRRQQPDMRFFAGPNGPIQRNVNSAALYHYNSRSLTLDQAEPGDLIFFQNEEGRIIGLGLISRITTSSVHFITASANAGMVIESHALIGGDYWNSSVAGFGRLTYTLAR